MVETVVQFQPFGIKTPVRTGMTLLDAAAKAGVSLEAICGGAGKCGKCKVTVTAGASLLSQTGEDEKSLLSDRETRAGTRLACRAKVVKAGRVVVEGPEGSRREHHRLLAKGVARLGGEGDGWSGVSQAVDERNGVGGGHGGVF